MIADQGSSKMPFWPSVLASVIGGLILVGITAGLTLMFAKRRYERKFTAAVESYAGALHQLIDARIDNLASRDILIAARSIVSARNSMTARLTRLDELLNSNIDRLESQIEELGGDAPSPEGVEKMADTISVIKRTWPTKADLIKVELRKLFAELGLE